jgi:hypothetical protein
MSKLLRYTPVLRLRQEEKKVLTEYNFGNQIYPLVEIIKEVDRKPPNKRNGKPLKNVKQKTFEECYLNILKNIKCSKLFVDLPVHMKEQKGVQTDVLEFLRKVVAIRKHRTEYMIKLKPLANRIIPVISTYSDRTGEPNTIISQEGDLRPHFENLAFRTFPKTFTSDIKQIEKIALKNDYLIVDLDDYEANPNDDDLEIILQKLKQFNQCHILIIRAAMGEDITNKGLVNGCPVDGSDNRLLETFRKLYANSFGDYAGIKKDAVRSAPAISPGFIYYDATENEFYGFRGTDNQDLTDFETIIVPKTIASEATKRMQNAGLPFLSSDNKGWQIINNISKGLESGLSQAKFKRIAILHYLHCISSKITALEFEP